MIQSTISFYVMEFYKQFAAYTTQQLQEFGLSFGMMYFVIYVGESIPDLPPGIFRLGCTKFERADRRGTAPAPEPAAKGSTDEERECVTCTTPS